MRAGLLNEIINVVTPIINENEYGEKIEDYQDKLTTRAYIRHINGSRNIENDEIVNNYTKEFITRIYHNITEGDLIIWDSKKYRIICIDKDKSKQQLTIKTEMINE